MRDDGKVLTDIVCLTFKARRTNIHRLRHGKCRTAVNIPGQCVSEFTVTKWKFVALLVPRELVLLNYYYPILCCCLYFLVSLCKEIVDRVEAS